MDHPGVSTERGEESAGSGACGPPERGGSAPCPRGVKRVRPHVLLSDLAARRDLPESWGSATYVPRETPRFEYGGLGIQSTESKRIMKVPLSAWTCWQTRLLTSWLFWTTMIPRGPGEGQME
jgi:hypothetical protein